MDAAADGDQQSRMVIAARLRSGIESGLYPAGTKLPSYRQLASEFGAARDTVMEAVQRLAREGLVTIRPKSGALVRDPSERSLDPAVRLLATRDELLAVRQELGAVRRAVEGLEDQVTDLLGRLPE